MSESETDGLRLIADARRSDGVEDSRLEELGFVSTSIADELTPLDVANVAAKMMPRVHDAKSATKNAIELVQEASKQLKWLRKRSRIGALAELSDKAIRAFENEYGPYPISLGTIARAAGWTTKDNKTDYGKMRRALSKPIKRDNSSVNVPYDALKKTGVNHFELTLLFSAIPALQNHAFDLLKSD